MGARCKDDYGIEPVWVSLAKAGYIVEALIKLLESKHGRKLIRKLIMEKIEEEEAKHGF